MNQVSSSQIFYTELATLRDLFHKYGKFDDANTKLDEIAKYLAIYVFQTRYPGASGLPIKQLLIRYGNDKGFALIAALKSIFSEIAGAPDFRNADGQSVFGSQPQLNITDDDNEFAAHLLHLVVRSVDSLSEQGDHFDLLNECFGHFVRDNFRNHIEDAQYMTPNEAVDFICDLALNDLSDSQPGQDFVVMDPCCGVGSFLNRFYAKNSLTATLPENSLRLIGQDKVERMARLAKINLFMSGCLNHAISNGNSLAGESFISGLNGQVDLILTNPPFGAKFTGAELKGDVRANYPLLYDVILKNGASFNSEILFVDRCMSLLKPGGKLLAILPDSVISSSGLNSVLRTRLAYNTKFSIKAIIELPAVAFAQAGTRTKTSILYLEKNDLSHTLPVFIAKCDNLGFEVSTKKGATVKYDGGTNDLPAIAEQYKERPASLIGKTVSVLLDRPSCVLVEPETLQRQSWTPNHYHASKFQIVEALATADKAYELVKLADIVNFETNFRKKEIIPDHSKCISILHVSDENLNVEELLSYKPKYQGIVCKPGDLLFSKINPRIPRALVVPALSFPLTCSSEFEIMNSKSEFSNYAVKILLMLPSVQTQINTLTSGTSSSHNRIKTRDLSNILLPIPKKGTAMYDAFLKSSRAYADFEMQYNRLKADMYGLRKDMTEMLS